MIKPMLKLGDVARRLNITTRHVHTLEASGRMPRGARLGKALRWPEEVLEAWIAAGCPPVTQAPTTDQDGSGEAHLDALASSN